MAQLTTQGTQWPEYVQWEFQDLLERGRLEHGLPCESRGMTELEAVNPCENTANVQTKRPPAF